MDDKSGVVDAVAGTGVEHDVSVEVDLQQAGRGDLVVHHAVGVDEEVPFLAGHARRDVVIDKVIHAVVVDEAIAGGEIDARFPFGGRDAAAHRLDLQEGQIAHPSIMRRVTPAA
jgi:hypothetical protein